MTHEEAKVTIIVEADGMTMTTVIPRAARVSWDQEYEEPWTFGYDPLGRFHSGRMERVILSCELPMTRLGEHAFTVQYSERKVPLDTDK